MNKKQQKQIKKFQKEQAEEDNDDPNNGIFNQGRGNTNQKPNKEYTPIDQYKPSGIYNKEIFDKLQKRL